MLWILGPHTGPLLFDAVASLDTSPLAAARYHGDQDVAPGVLDFAVNVRHDRPPEWLVRQLAALLPELARYPSTDDVHRAQDAVAERHGRTRDEVLPLVGAAEGFALLHNLSPVRAAIVVPAFTEPAIALSAAGITAHHVVLKPPFVLDTAHVPDDADLVVVGNPTNPTSVLHLREQLLELRRPGRILVVDEAFADWVPGEPQSLADDSLPDVLVLRSLTKTWSLAGLRVGYALGSPDVLARLTVQRAHWPLGTLQLTAIAACCRSAPRRGAVAGGPGGGCGIGRDVGLPPAAVAVSEFLLDRHWLVWWWRPRFFPAARPDLGVGEIAQADRCQNAERDPLDAIGQERPGI